MSGNCHQYFQQSQKFLWIGDGNNPSFKLANKLILIKGDTFVVLHVPFDEVHHEEGKRIGEVVGTQMVENRPVKQFSVVFGGDEGALHEVENDNLIRLKQFFIIGNLKVEEGRDDFVVEDEGVVLAEGLVFLDEGNKDEDDGTEGYKCRLCLIGVE